MGSSGHGTFGNYRGINGSGNKEIGNGNEYNEIECPSLIENIRLEDVAISEYFLKNNKLPEVNESVHLRKTLFSGRLVIESAISNEIIGNLPTQYNYLRRCIQKGMDYNGTVISSGDTPIHFIVINLYG